MTATQPTKQRSIVLIDHTASIGISTLKQTAVAFTTQIQRDLAPHWKVSAEVSAARTKTRDEWLVHIYDQPTTPGAGGVHLTNQGIPYAEVLYNDNWTIEASHEILEMLVDPAGKKFHSAQDIDPSSDGHSVKYLVEVCDPCERFTYEIDGVTVSDFILPDYYAPTTRNQRDFLGKLTEPVEVAKGGYISWYDSADHRWHQDLDGTFRTADIKAEESRSGRDKALGSSHHDLLHNFCVQESLVS